MNPLCLAAQKYFDWELAARPPLLYRLIPRQVRTALRLGLIRCGDPSAEFEIGGRRLEAPISHELPFVLVRWPVYELNLGRLGLCAARKYPDLTIIDIGANIGDSAAILCARIDRPILCVEGHPKYLPILRRNVSHLSGDIEIAPVFIGGRSGESALRVDAFSGTARIRTSTDQPGDVKLQTLSAVLSEHPRFEKSKLLKIDTDGFDCEIIESHADWISKARPVLFFEYDPNCFAERHPPGYTIFPTLAGIGYSKFVIYTNFGDFLVSADAAESRLLAEVDAFYRGRKSESYCDIAAFHADDADLWTDFRDSELAFYREFRSAESTAARNTKTIGSRGR